MWQTLAQWDFTALSYINAVWTNPVLDKVMAAASSFALFKIPLALGLLAMLIWGRFRERLFLVLIGLCLLIGDAGLTNAGKDFIGRPRPHEAHAGVRVVDLNEVKWSEASPPKRGRSFPSGHTCNNIALAVVATVIYGRWALLLWPWALLVGYSRVYTGSHYPSDVLGSILLSILTTLLILYAVEWLWQKIAPRVCPKLYAAHNRLIFGARKTS